MAHSRMVTSFQTRRFDYAGGFSTLDGTICGGEETSREEGTMKNKRSRARERDLPDAYHPLRIATNPRVSIQRERESRNLMIIICQSPDDVVTRAGKVKRSVGFPRELPRGYFPGISPLFLVSSLLSLLSPCPSRRS